MRFAFGISFIASTSGSVPLADGQFRQCFSCISLTILDWLSAIGILNLISHSLSGWGLGVVDR